MIPAPFFLGTIDGRSNFILLVAVHLPRLLSEHESCGLPPKVLDITHKTFLILPMSGDPAISDHFALTAFEEILGGNILIRSIRLLAFPDVFLSF